MISISFSDEMQKLFPDLKIGVIECEVENSSFNENLWKEIDLFSESLISTSAISEIKKDLAIAATRKAYKLLGKDPNRYRPSSESLRRRILKGSSLYQKNTLVDLINLISLQSGYSIGGFDLDKIQGDLCLGIGEKDEPYFGIGRGVLNIENLPVYRDHRGGIGTPTSDEERTKIEETTTHLLLIINAYSGLENLENTISFSLDLLRKYAKSSKEQTIILPSIY